MSDRNSPQVEVALAGIPIRFRDPILALYHWRSDAERFINLLNYDANRTMQQATEAKDVSLTEQRLSLVAEACRANAKALLHLLDPLLKHKSLDRVTRGQPSLHHANPLAAQFTCIFRDWVWGQAEIDQQLRLLHRSEDGSSSASPPERILIVGGGAGRLAFELAERYPASSLTVTEVDPLMALVMKEMFSGASLELHEISELPQEVLQAAHGWEIQAARAVANVEIILDDFLEETLAAASFDLVITPWVIDILPAPIDEILRKIHRVLKPGGRWHNIGPLMFRTSERKVLMVATEVIERATRAGFEVGPIHQEQISQMKSPNLATYRTDLVYSWTARASAQPKKQLTVDAAAGTMTTDLPVRLGFDLEEAAQSYHLMYAILIGANAGRSIREIATDLAPDFGLPVESVERIVVKMINEFTGTLPANSLGS